MSSVSVVITTLDDHLTMRDCLDGVLRGGSSVAEVLVVDRGSRDGTQNIVRGAGAPVRLIERTGSRPSEAVAAGVAQARGDVLVLVPSRTVVGAGTIEACAAKAAASSGKEATADLRPVGTTTFGRAAAAIVGRDGPRVEARLRHPPSNPTADPSQWQIIRPSSYLVPDAPARLAAEAFRPRAGWRSTATAGLVATAAIMAVFGRGWLRAAVPLGHATATGVRALRAGRDPGVAPHRAFLAAEVWDWSTGAGWWMAAARRRWGPR